MCNSICLCISSVQLLSHVWLFATPWIAALQASLSITNSYMNIWIYIQIHIYTICMCMYMYGIPRWCSGKESACQCRRCMKCGFDPWVWKIPWKRIWYLPPVFLPGKFHEQRSLAGYSSWGHNESDMTNTMHAHTHVCVCVFIYIHIIHIYMGLPWWLREVVKNPPTMQQMVGSVTGSGRSPGGQNVNLLQYSWKIPWTEEPGGLQSIGILFSNQTTTCTHIHTHTHGCTCMHYFCSFN